jgi:hypothetical protein
LFGDLSLTLFFVVMITLQSANIWAASSAIAHRAYDFALVSIVLFVAMQAAIFVYFCIDWAHQAPGTEGVLLEFTEHSYAWTFLLVSSVWFLSNIVAAWLTNET